MARPTTISDERILEAARAVFLEYGIAATTAEVAKRAGIAEGSIFKRFATKAELFKAAMMFEFEDPDFIRTLVGARDEDDPRETLFQVGLQAVGFFRRMMPLISFSMVLLPAPFEPMMPNASPRFTSKETS